MHFLIRCEKEGLAGIGRRLNTEHPLSRSLLAPVLPDSSFLPEGAAVQMLRGTVEEQLAVAREMQTRQIVLGDLGLTQRKIKAHSCRSLRALGVIRRGLRHDADWIADQLVDRYDCPGDRIWRALLGSEYEHALQILIEADACYDSSRSHWLSLQDSFNDVVVRRLFDYLKTRNMPGHSKTQGADGKLVDFGTLIQVNGPFNTTYPGEAGLLRDIHERRNQLPGSHPYDKKGGAKNRFLGKGEQPQLVIKLKQLYTGITGIIRMAP